MNNRIANCHNRFQDHLIYPRALCVCSAGLLRSPTMAWVLSNPPFNYNTRAAGAVPEYALVPVDTVLLEWADIIVCAEEEHAEIVRKMIAKEAENLTDPAKTVYVLNIPDSHKFRDVRLEKLIAAKALTIIKGKGD